MVISGEIKARRDHCFTPIVGRSFTDLEGSKLIKKKDLQIITMVTVEYKICHFRIFIQEVENLCEVKLSNDVRSGEMNLDK